MIEYTIKTFELNKVWLVEESHGSYKQRYTNTSEQELNAILSQEIQLKINLGFGDLSKCPLV